MQLFYLQLVREDITCNLFPRACPKHYILHSLQGLYLIYPKPSQHPQVFLITANWRLFPTCNTVNKVFDFSSETRSKVKDLFTACFSLLTRLLKLEKLNMRKARQFFLTRLRFIQQKCEWKLHPCALMFSLSCKEHMTGNEKCSHRSIQFQFPKNLKTAYQVFQCILFVAESKEQEKLK